MKRKPKYEIQPIKKVVTMFCTPEEDKEIDAYFAKNNSVIKGFAYTQLLLNSIREKRIDNDM